MGEIIVVALIAWAITSAVDRGKTEYGHVRDRHLKDVQKQHPDWSPRRQQRVAKHRARGYWWDQIAGGFPEMRSAYRENRELAKVERAEAEAARAKRWAELKQRLDAAHAEREKHVADRVAADPKTDKAKARNDWLHGRKLGKAVRTAVAAGKLELNDQGGRPATAPAGDSATKPARTRPKPASGAPEPPRVIAPEAEAPAARQCRSCGVQLPRDNAQAGICGGCAELALANLDLAGLRRQLQRVTGDDRRRVEDQISQLEKKRNELQRQAAERKTDASGLKPVAGANRNGDSQDGPRLVTCRRCGAGVTKLYPDGDLAVCAECVELAKARDRLEKAREDVKVAELRLASVDRDDVRSRLSREGALDEARRRAAQAELDCRRGLKAAEARRDASRAANGRPDTQTPPETGAGAGKQTSDAGRGSPDSPPTGGGADNDTTTTGGNPVEAPNIDVARANATSVASQIGTVAAGCEQMEADLLAGGLGNDQAALQKFAAAKEALLTAQAAFTEFVNELNKHASGEEYANTGHAAKTEFLQHA